LRPGGASGGFDGTGAFLAYAFSFFVIFVLYLFRNYDNNRLVGWNWVFDHVDAGGFFIILALGFVAAYLVSAFRLPGPRGIFLLSLLIGAFSLPVPEVIIDASRYFMEAKYLGQYGVGYFLQQWGGQIEPWTDLPLVPFLYGLGFRFIGEHRVVVQGMVLLMFASSVMVTSILGRDLFGDRIGRLAGLSLLSIPYLYTQVPLMMVDVPAMFFFVLAVFAFTRGLSRGGLWAGLFAPVAIVMAFFTKYSLWPMLSVTVPIFALAFSRDRRAAPRALVITAVFALIAGPVLWYYRDFMAWQLDLLVSYQRPGLGRWGESLISTFFYNVHPYITIAAIASVPFAIRERQSRYLPLIWLMVLVLIVLDVRRIRYTIPVLPAFSIMAAYALDRLDNARAVRSLAYTAVVTSFILALFAYGPFLRQYNMANLRDAGRFLGTLDPGRIEVVTLAQKSRINPAVAVGLLDLYTSRELVYEQAPHETPAAVETSPFRFAWEYKTPPYYLPGNDSSGQPRDDMSGYVVVISGDDSCNDDFRISEEHKLVKKFCTYEGLFRFRTFVRVYERE
jgi:4-amino-4-deoxy-L-arabinose transferase-like glycosyltransferase